MPEKEKTTVGILSRAMQMQSRVKMQNQMHIQRLGDDETPFWLPVGCSFRYSLGQWWAYYRGAMGILLVYDVTDDSSFNRFDRSLRPLHCMEN
ncbi:hypothetical protein Q3G72_009654 [Acer saccharum]|nr:hypothetical protein Q3G72_009654 [Acer saccharum]